MEGKATERQGGAGGAVDGAIHAAAAQQRGIGGVYDGVNVSVRNIAQYNGKHESHLTKKYKKQTA